MADEVIGINDQLRARLVAHWAGEPETKALRSFHPFRVVRDAAFWHKPVGTRITPGRTPSDQELHAAAAALHAGTLSDVDRWMFNDPHRPDVHPDEEAVRLERARRVLASNDPELHRRYFRGEDV
jgi:hypothetical protein